MPSKVHLKIPPGLHASWATVRSRLPELNFITIHYAFFISISLLAAVVFWASSNPLNSINFTDALFLTVSAVTEAGLNTVNLSQINTWQQVMLFILIIIGSPVFVSCAIVYVRLKAFEKAFIEYKKQRQASGRTSTSWWPKKLSRARQLVDVAETEKEEQGRDNSKRSNVTSLGQSSDAGSASSNESRSVGKQRYAGSFKDSSTSTGRGRELQVEQEASRPQCPSLSPAGRESDHQDHAEIISPVVGFAQNTNFGPPRNLEQPYKRVGRPLFSFTGVGATAHSTMRPRATSSAEEVHRRLTRAATSSVYDQSKAEHLTSHGWISRNSQIHGLTVEERHKLGGREYRAVVLLSWLVPFYITMWQGLGAISLGSFIRAYHAQDTRVNAQNPFWVGSFMAISAFGNTGMSLLDANMTAFQTSPFILVSMSLFILAGNTAYPIFLRGAIWVLWKILPENDRWAEDKVTCRFLLDHPRRVYTNLFPSNHTWWLALTLIILNGLDWMFFEVLSIGDQDIQDLSKTTRILGGLFQAFAVRSGGFYVVPIPTLRLSLQFLYVLMMYISVYPVTITMRNSNVYEERSLGIFAEDIDHENTHAECTDPKSASKSTSSRDDGAFSALKRRMTAFAEVAAPAPKREKRSYFMRQQLRAQLAHDAWFAVVAIFLILIIETNQLEADPVNFSVFNVIFEVISGYSTVGLSVGVINNAYSFSGSWHILSKLVLCAVMLRGRHRGLPVAIDHAIQLPGQRMWDAEDEDGERRMERLDALAARTEMKSPSVMLKSPGEILRKSNMRDFGSKSEVAQA